MRQQSIAIISIPSEGKRVVYKGRKSRTPFRRTERNIPIDALAPTTIFAIGNAKKRRD